MAFAEDLAAFLDTEDGFAVSATVNGSAADVILDAPGADVFDGAVATTEPSALVRATAAPATGQAIVVSAPNLPAQLAHLAGTYSIRSVMPEPPDGAFVRCILGKTA